MKVKICGITDMETAKRACEYGADALGFVFAESKRKITPGASERNHSGTSSQRVKNWCFRK